MNHHTLTSVSTYLLYVLLLLSLFFSQSSLYPLCSLTKPHARHDIKILRESALSSSYPVHYLLRSQYSIPIAAPTPSKHRLTISSLFPSLRAPSLRLSAYLTLYLLATSHQPASTKIFMSLPLPRGVAKGVH